MLSFFALVVVHSCNYRDITTSIILHLKIFTSPFLIEERDRLQAELQKKNKEIEEMKKPKSSGGKTYFALVVVHSCNYIQRHHYIHNIAFTNIYFTFSYVIICIQHLWNGRCEKRKGYYYKKYIKQHMLHSLNMLNCFLLGSGKMNE